MSMIPRHKSIERDRGENLKPYLPLQHIPTMVIQGRLSFGMIVWQLQNNRTANCKEGQLVEQIQLIQNKNYTVAKPCFANTCEESWEFFKRKLKRHYHMDNQG